MYRKYVSEYVSEICIGICVGIRMGVCIGICMGICNGICTSEFESYRMFSEIDPFRWFAVIAVIAVTGYDTSSYGMPAYSRLCFYN